MAWRIEYDAGAEKDLFRLDRQIAQRILKFLGGRVAKLEDPRSIGEALKGSVLGDFWKYRVGDYRIIVEIQDKSCAYTLSRLAIEKKFIDKRTVVAPSLNRSLIQRWEPRT